MPAPCPRDCPGAGPAALAGSCGSFSGRDLAAEFLRGMLVGVALQGADAAAALPCAEPSALVAQLAREMAQEPPGGAAGRGVQEHPIGRSPDDPAGRRVVAL